MGCDIHMWAEYREAPDAPWKMLLDTSCSRCGGSTKIDKTECYACEGTGISRLRWENEAGDKVEASSNARLYGGNVYRGRNYPLFAMLAGVRNSEEYPPLFEPRDVPPDASPEYRRMVEQDDGDGHTHSWLNVNEIVAVFLNELDPKLERAGHFATHTYNEILKPLADKYGGENVRIVFHFDN